MPEMTSTAEPGPLLSRSDLWAAVRKSRAELDHAVGMLSSVQTYTTHKAGRLRGVFTADQGKVRGVTYFRIKTWDHSNAAFWFIPAEYTNYVALPEVEGVTWVAEENYSDAHKKLFAKCKAAQAAYNEAFSAATEAAD